MESRTNKAFKVIVALVTFYFINFSLIDAQTHQIDSLQALIKTDKADTNKVKHLNALAFAFYHINPDTTILLARQSDSLAKKLSWATGEANADRDMGLGYRVEGDYSKALDYYHEALKIAEGTGDRRLQAKILASIGIAYQTIGDYTKALEYDKLTLELDKETGNKNGIAYDLSNLGIIYSGRGDYTNALDNLIKAIDIEEEIGDKSGLALDLNNIGGAYQALGYYPKALDYYFRALQLVEKTGDKSGMAADYGSIGTLYSKTGKFKEAEEYLKKAISIDSSIGERNFLREFEEAASQLYDTTGRYQLALEWYKKAMVLKDTLFNADKNKAITRKEMTYDFEKKETARKAEQDKKDAVAEADKRRQNIIIWSVCGGLILVLLFAGFIFRSLRITSRQKSLIERKNRVIEEKNKDILDSITYAKRLQDAILPPLSVVKKYLPESFVLYKPKDIVAGDFYWLERTESAILIAACDCTGHGVPGAMVSVVCSNALNRALNEFKIRDTGKMLDKVRELVLETFAKSEGEVKDGMDCSFCAINTKTNQVEWSGAYNPLWYIRSGEMKEVPADKQPIGKTDNPKPFTTHTIQLQKGDTLYLFTDGYADQFGGPKGKKFKYKQLQQLIMDNSQLTMAEQKKVLEQTFEEWRGNLEQVDDVLIIGIRV